MRGEVCGPGGGRAWGWRRKRRAWGRPDSRREGQGTREAHLEHLFHVRDLGGVKAHRLVERRRALPSRGRACAIRDEVRAGRREGVGAAAQAACTGKRPDPKAWGSGHARSARRTSCACS
jgi:hypothetical protein